MSLGVYEKKSDVNIGIITAFIVLLRINHLNSLKRMSLRSQIIC